MKKFVAQYENADFFKNIRKTSTELRNCSISREKASDEMGTIKTQLGIGISNGATIESERKKFYELISVYEKLVFECFSKKDDFILIFDDLDEIEKERNLAEDIIIDLINQAKEINLRKHKGKLKIILLLRSDILNELQLKNAN